MESTKRTTAEVLADLKAKQLENIKIAQEKINAHKAKEKALKDEEEKKMAIKEAEEIAKAKAIQDAKEKEEAEELAIKKAINDTWKEKVAKKDQEILAKKCAEKPVSINQSLDNEHIENQDKDFPAFEGIIADCFNDAEFWCDQERQSGITVMVNGHYEHFLVGSELFKDYVYNISFKVNSKTLRKSQYSEILDTITSICKYHGKKCTSHLRIAENNGKTYIDLVNDKWEAIEIDEFGWRIVTPNNFKFIRTKDMLPQCKPEQGGNIEELRQFLNLEKDEDFVLLVGFILKCLDPHSPYPILALIGEQGSGKTETSQMITSLVAPSRVPMRSMPSSEQNFMLAAKNNYIFTIDNVSEITRKQSDWICRLSTGSGYSSRALFTNSEECTIFLSRPLILNGINDIVERADLIDRTILINLPQITEDSRQSKQSLWNNFNALKPKILGALCDGLSRAIRYRDLVNLTKKPRLTHLAEFMTAAEVAFNWDYETFLNAYMSNIFESGQTNLSSNPLALAMLEYSFSVSTLESTASDLMRDLIKYSGWRTYVKFLPTHPNKFSEELTRIIPLLRKQGIFVQRLKSNGKRLIRVTNTNNEKIWL